MQERDKATAIIKEMFPDAEVTNEVNSSSQVKISSNGTEIVSVAQRDLYRKYKWPAEPKIKQMLEMYKEEMHS